MDKVTRQCSQTTFLKRKVSRSSLLLHQLRRVTACVTTSLNIHPTASHGRVSVSVSSTSVSVSVCVCAACVCVCVCVYVCRCVCDVCHCVRACARACVCQCKLFSFPSCYYLPSETAMTDQKWCAIAGRQPDSNTRTPRPRRHSQSVQ